MQSCTAFVVHPCDLGVCAEGIRAHRPQQLELAQSAQSADGAREPDLAGAPPPIQAESPRLGAGRPPRARGPSSQHALSRSGLDFPLQVSLPMPPSSLRYHFLSYVCSCEIVQAWVVLRVRENWMFCRCSCRQTSRGCAPAWRGQNRCPGCLPASAKTGSQVPLPLYRLPDVASLQEEAIYYVCAIPTASAFTAECVAC